MPLCVEAYNNNDDDDDNDDGAENKASRTHKQRARTNSLVTNELTVIFILSLSLFLSCMCV